MVEQWMLNERSEFWHLIGIWNDTSLTWHSAWCWTDESTTQPSGTCLVTIALAYQRVSYREITCSQTFQSSKLNLEQTEPQCSKTLGVKERIPSWLWIHMMASIIDYFTPNIDDLTRFFPSQWQWRVDEIQESCTSIYTRSHSFILQHRAVIPAKASSIKQ